MELKQQLMLLISYQIYKRKMKDLEVEDTKVQNTNTQNNIFLSGSTEELLKSLKEAGSINNNPIHEDK